jgi:hypothetical protein
MRRVLLTVLLSSVALACVPSPASARTWISERDCFTLSSGTICAELWERDDVVFYLKARAYQASGRFYVTAVQVRRNCCEVLARASAGYLSAGQVKDTSWVNRGLFGCAGADYSAVVGFNSPSGVHYTVRSAGSC